MSNISERIAALSPEQKALLERRLHQKKLNNLKLQAEIKPQKKSDEVILSYAQERLWLLDQLQPELPLYNEINLFKLTGSLDILLLEKSFNKVLQRHQVLRSKFITKNGKPVAQIIPNQWVTLPVIRIEEQSNPEAIAIALATQEARKPFNLSEFPLFRLKLYQISEQEYLLLLVVNHIICDGWSMGIFIREIVTLYQAFLEGKPSPLPELSIQYTDFAWWEKQLPDQIYATQLNYWKKQLSGSLPHLELPTLNQEIKTSNVNSCRGARESILLSPQLSQALKTLSQQQNVTLFMLLLAAFKVLLSRHTALEDILVGSVTANRNRPELEDAIGLFLNTLVLRSDLSDDPTFIELLQQVKRVALEAYSNQDLPFEKLVAHLHPERNISQSPLFQVMFILHNLPSSDLELPGLTVEEVAIDHGMALFDLTLEIRDRESGLEVCCEYKSDRFGIAQIERMLLHYQTLLENVVVNPDLHLSQINLLTETEKQQLLIEFNDNSRDYPVTKTIEQLFEAQVTKTPNDIAIVHRHFKLTYRELNTKANQLARLLQSLDLQPGELVSIWQERSVNFAIAILAVLKAGGVYVPIDHTYPPERIAYLLSNSESRIVLSDDLCLKNAASILENCPHLKDVVSVDSCDFNPTVALTQTFKTYTTEDFQTLSTDNLELPLTGVEPAYTIYTSGSTGLPKGAMIRHGGAINHIYAQYDALQLTSNLTFLQSAPASSDISVWQFLAPLLIGGKTIIIDTETVCDPLQLFQTIQQQQITLVELVPQVLKSLLQYLTDLPPQARQLPSLQWMMVTGESVSVELVNHWLQLYPNIAVVNAYGPSEASDDITQEIITQPLPTNQRSVSIGKPLANLNLYILDRNLQLLPIGVAGEICVSGYGVGVGYWRNEEKTKANFVPNPFTETAKALPGTEVDLLYKTGDLGRWLPDGRIEYLGRIDHQVKIRGFRIELGEIETVLSQHPAIKEAVAIALEDDSGDKKIVAYVVPRHPNLVNNRELIPQLRQFLETRLPKQMIPSALMALPSFPLTPSGKIDRRALPAIEATPKEFLPPQTETEKTVAAIWQEVLKQAQISLDDNFFELGGHSLLATQVISRLREQYQQEIPLRSLFEEPTVAQLASYLDSMKALQNLQTIPTEINSDLAKGEARCGQLRWRDREEIEL